MHGLSIGQHVRWKYTYPSGYGKTVFVEAEIVKLNKKTARIKAIQINRKTGASDMVERNAKYELIVESDIYIKSPYLKY